MGKKKSQEENYWDEDFEKDLEEVIKDEHITDTSIKEPERKGKTDLASQHPTPAASSAASTAKEKRNKKKDGGNYWDEDFEKDHEPITDSPVDKKENEKKIPLKNSTSKAKPENRKLQPSKGEVDAQMESLSLNSKTSKVSTQKHESQSPQKSSTSSKMEHSSHQSKASQASAKLANDDAVPKAVPKGRAAAVAAIREALEARKAEEDRLQAENERAQREEEELMRKAEAEQLQRDEEKKRKKEKEKQKKETLKREGKLLTKAEKERKARNADYLESLKAQGFKLPNTDEKSHAEVGGEKLKKIEKKHKNFSGSDFSNKSERNANQNNAERRIDDGEDEEEAENDDWEKLLEAKEKSHLATQLRVGGSITNDANAEVLHPKTDRINSSSLNTQADATEKIDKRQSTETQPLNGITEEIIHKKATVPKNDLRSPICCVLGHVDTGKTKLLDKLRQTNVQEGEAGGITQQIGATYFPAEAIIEKIQPVNRNCEFSLKVPGLLVIDTPGHESFTNLRTRGSSLCNIAILVVDIMHGLEQQTLESIQLLRQRKTPFIVALNKIDRLYNWKTMPGVGFLETFAQQPANVQTEFDNRYRQIMLAFAEQGLNVELFYRNKDMRRIVSVVPTSAHSGEGIPDMLLLVMQLTQNMMSSQLMYLSELQCTVLEVKVIAGLGTTVDVVLTNGILREGDKIVVCGLGAPIVTVIRALLTPQPMKEMRIKSDYIHHKEVKASLGVKIVATDLEKAVAGSRLLVAADNDDVEALKSEVMKDFTDLFEKIDKSGKGVYVQASTIGSLEALLEFLTQMKVPVCDIAIGPVFKKDVMRASVMLEQIPEYAVILAFDVKVEKEAEDMAKDCGVLIFKADIIYHLFDMFKKHMDEIRAKKRVELANQAVFPCILKIIPTYIFNRSAPIIIGVDVKEGVLKMGTPICIPSKENLFLGRITSIEANHKPVDSAKKGQSVAIKIESNDSKMYGRHFDQNDDLYSQISRQSIDVLKEHFREEVGKDEWILIIKMKSIFGIQ